MTADPAPAPTAVIGALAVMGAENAEVSLAASVAVAVIDVPAVSGRAALKLNGKGPAATAVTDTEPR